MTGNAIGNLNVSKRHITPEPWRNSLHSFSYRIFALANKPSGIREW